MASIEIGQYAELLSQADVSKQFDSQKVLEPRNAGRSCSISSLSAYQGGRSKGPYQQDMIIKPSRAESQCLTVRRIKGIQAVRANQFITATIGSKARDQTAISTHSVAINLVVPSKAKLHSLGIFGVHSALEILIGGK